MTTAGDATDQVNRARAQIQAFGTLATTVGTSLLTVSGYQAYVKKPVTTLTLLLLAAIIVLLVATVWVWTSYPGRPATTKELTDQYPALAEKAGVDLKEAFEKARNSYVDAATAQKRLDERVKAGRGVSESDRAWMNVGWSELAERQLRELGELIRTRRQALGTKLALAGFAAAEVVVAVCLFATVS